MAMSEAEQRVVDGTAWEEFCDALKDAGKILQSEKAPQDPFTQAEGYRYLTRLLRTHGGNVEDAAAEAGMNMATIYRKLKKYGINKKDLGAGD